MSTKKIIRKTSVSDGQSMIT